jgi:hypothetical protein
MSWHSLHLPLRLSPRHSSFTFTDDTASVTWCALEQLFDTHQTCMGLDIARRPPDRLVQPQRTTIPANAGERRVPAAKRENKECAHNHEGK